MKILKRLIQSRKNSVATGTAMALAAFAIFSTSCSDYTTEMAETVEPTKIVFISGIPSHPSGQHEFKAGTILLARALEEQSGLPVEVAIAHHGWPEDESIFDGAKAAADIVTGIPTRENINRYVHWNQTAEKLLGTKQTMMWAVERPDGGRGIGFTGGHWHRNWAIDDFRKVVLNAIIWVADIEVPQSGVSSEAITETQLNENLDEKKEMLHVALPSEADLTQPAAKPVPYKWPGMPKP